MSTVEVFMPYTQLFAAFKGAAYGRRCLKVALGLKKMYYFYAA